MPFKEEAIDLTMGNLWTSIWQISWPMLLVMIFNFFVGLTDIYVAGFISPDVQAVVGFVGQIYFLIILIANAISIGTVALLSRAIGARNYDHALEIARQSLAFSALSAVALTVFGLAFPREIVLLAGFPPGIQEMGVRFLRIFALALGPNYLLIISNAIFRASGEVKKNLLSMFLVSIINIVGNFIFVFGIFSFPGLGYIGIALATALSATVGMVVCLVLFRTSRWRLLYARPWSFSPSLTRKIIDLSWPAALLQIAWNAGSLILYNILGRLGQESITGLSSLTNGLRIEAVIYLPAFALHMAASVLVGQNLGAGNPERAEKIGWKITFSGIILISVMALFIFAGAERLASLVTKSPDVLAETARYLRIMMLSEPFMALSTILGGSLQGAGDTKGAMWIVVIAMWLVRIPLAYFLALGAGYGALGVWVAMVASMLVQGTLIAWRFRRGRWKELHVEWERNLS
ncbi:MAG: MATE family efflux transporter [Alphaproteobacteria bacterium]|uniref:Multidrug-efflux transporter n=1 Tax=Candidatus Nitrobium versatile TaxID=2884831 RepID=A0A953J2Y9_9BACT|nr:MATE family efflux transporter [Candidatus Nitrobium versatile]